MILEKVPIPICTDLELNSLAPCSADEYTLVTRIVPYFL